MRTIFKAYLSLATEEINNNNNYQDHGCIETFTASTLDLLKNKIQQKIRIPKQAELFDGYLQWSTEGAHDYKTPKKERRPYYELWTLCIEKQNCYNIDAVVLK